ncbi:hypothetical protein FQA47_004492 [Oryzias melastigma]|uniref:Uncharacterized protein n=1 Tax=Oryzias melastigma TaxID=30732 RepID=A0A834CBX7_ORYME|nr:hypothetical protein FQA47_004492 [Oryzias melastigma]
MSAGRYDTLGCAGVRSDQTCRLQGVSVPHSDTQRRKCHTGRVTAARGARALWCGGELEEGQGHTYLQMIAATTPPYQAHTPQASDSLHHQKLNGLQLEGR